MPALAVPGNGHSSVVSPEVGTGDAGTETGVGAGQTVGVALG